MWILKVISYECESNKDVKKYDDMLYTYIGPLNKIRRRNIIYKHSEQLFKYWQFRQSDLYIFHHYYNTIPNTIKLKF